jgi:hypothetical protein
MFCFNTPTQRNFNLIAIVSTWSCVLYPSCIATISLPSRSLRELRSKVCVALHHVKRHGAVLRKGAGAAIVIVVPGPLDQVDYLQPAQVNPDCGLVTSSLCWCVVLAHGSAWPKDTRPDSFRPLLSCLAFLLLALFCLPVLSLVCTLPGRAGRRGLSCLAGCAGPAARQDHDGAEQQLGSP